MKTKKELREFIKKIIREAINEAGPSAQGIIQPWLGPTLADDEGVPMNDEEDHTPPSFILP